MNLTKKMILALSALAVAGVSYAQNATATETAPVGLLGQSYSEIHFGATDIKHFSKNQYGLGVAANVPVTPYLDLGAGYDYATIRGLGHYNTVSSGVTAFKAYHGVKPFVGGGVGYQWIRAGGGKDNLFVWGASAGVEIPVSVVTLTPRIAYSDDFEDSRNSTQQTSYSVEANYWATKTLAVFGSVGYVDVNKSNNDAWQYSVGARFKF